MKRTLVAAVFALVLMGGFAQQASAAWWNQEFVAVRLDFDTYAEFEDPSPTNPGGSVVLVQGIVADAGTIFQLGDACFGDLIIPVDDSSGIFIPGAAQVSLRLDVDGNVIEAVLFVASDPFIPPIDLLSIF